MKRFFALFLSGILFAAGTAEAQFTSKAQSDPKEDKFAGEDSRYFKSGPTKTGAEIKKEFGKREVYRTTFKRRTYTGPSHAEFAEKAREKGLFNFQSAFPKGPYDIEFDSMEYDPLADVLTLKKFVVRPKPKGGEQQKTPALPIFTIDEMEVYGFNLGEMEDTPMNPVGTVRISKLEIPIFNERNIKKGNVLFEVLTLKGNFLKVMSDQKGELDEIEIAEMKSEAIINKLEINNIVRSRIMSAASANFKGVTVPEDFIAALKNQTLDGFKIRQANVNNADAAGAAGALAAMTSFSARILDPDMIIGAHMEAREKNPEESEGKFKRNAMQAKKTLQELKSERKKIADTIKRPEL